jgi:uncharacterized protein (TIRG00374 family)
VTDPSRPGVLAHASGRFVRLAIGLGLTVWLFLEADPSRIAQAFSRAKFTWIIWAITLVLVDRALMAYRWLLLLRAIEPGRTLPFRSVMRVFFVSTFLGTFLPASVGGDAIRTLALARLDVPAADAFASVVVDRLLGVLSVLLMGAGGLIVIRNLLDTWALVSTGAVTAAAIAGSLLLLFDSRILTGMVTWLTARHLAGVERIAVRALGAIRQYGEQRRTLAMVLTASVVVQVLRTLQAWCLGQALGLPISVVWYFAFIPVIVLIMTLPISVAGLGTSQLSFQLLFAMAGVASAEAWALSILFLALGLIGNLPGGWLFMTGDTRSQSQISG